MKRGKHLDITKGKEIVKREWKKLIDITTFRGYIFGGVLIGIILLVISPGLSNIITNIFNPADEDITLSDDSLGNTNPDDTIPDDTIPDDTVPNDTVPDDTIPDDTSSDDTTFYDVTSNGTMPRGTDPQIISVSEEMEEALANIRKLATGTTKDWVDDKLGYPFASNTIKVTETGRVWPHTDENSITGELLECIYIIFDAISVRAYFDIPDNSCKAFFVTLMEDTLDFDIVMPEVYLPFVSDKPLGEFTFSEIDGEPLELYGYVSQGVARVFYGEQYYYAGSGNYKDFYFTILDYGMLNSLPDFIWFLSNIQLDIYPSNGATGYSSSELLTQERDKLYPNTYGISTLNYELTFDLISSYGGFDSLPLRGWE